MKVTPSKALRAELPAMLGAVRMEETILKPIANALERGAAVTAPDGSPLEDLRASYRFEEIHPDDPELQDVSYRALALNSLFKAIGVLQNPSDPGEQLLHRAFLSQFRVFSKDEVLKDPYLSNVKVPEASLGDCVLGSDSYHAGEYFLYDAPLYDHVPYSGCVPRIGIFDTAFRYPAVARNGNVVSAVNPCGIKTAAPHIGKAHGNVLALGIGIGYFAYMAHLKPDVESVTVVDPDTDMTALFRERILPQFARPGKIRIVRTDPVEFVKTLDDGVYDTGFCDLCDGYDDYGPYLSVKTAARRLKKTKFSYWGEEGFLWYISKELIPIFTTDMCRASGVDPSEAEKEGRTIAGHADLMRFMRKVTAQEEIRKPADIQRLFDAKYLSRLIDKRKTAEWPIPKGDNA